MIRITVFCFFLSIVQVMAVDSYAQMTRMSLKVENERLENVFRKIEDESEFFFLYNKDLIDVEQMVSVDAQNETIKAILDEVLAGKDIAFTVFNRQIVLSNIDMINEIVAQQNPVSGTVTDESGQPLPGVTVVVKGTTQGTVTNADGNYSLSNIPDDATLVFSFVGMLTQEVVVGSQTSINVTMEVDAIGIEEVVAIGYGTMKKSDVTGAISSVSGADLAETLSPSILEQAQGRLAGVDIVRNNGSPGSPSSIRIRGNRSITASNDPLYVIDGIPTTISIDDFNPRDIESVEVLKDASSVAIYGSRGANGVILITTKRGKEGKSIIEFNNYYGIKSAIENIDLMNGNQFAEYGRIAYGYDRNDNSFDETVLGQVMSNNLQSGIETDWLDLVLQTGMQQEHQLSISGGNNALNYYISGSYYFEEGVIRQTDFERFSLRTNIDGNVSEKFKVGVSLTASTDIRNQMSNVPLSQAITYVPLVEPYDENGRIKVEANPVESYILSPLLNFAPNQYADETKGYRFFSNFFGNYSFTKDLSYRLNVGIDYNSNRRGQSEGNYYEGSVSTGSVNNNTNFSYTIENILTYDKIFDEHKINAVGLFSTQKQTYEASGLNGRILPISRSMFYDLGSSAEITGISSGLSEWGLLSYMGRINYQYKGRYLFTVSGRADGSSRLAAGNKWAFFPAASAAWIISEENFYNIPILDFFKIRIGYGQVGNTAISPYQTLGGLSRTSYAFGDEGAFGFKQSAIANPELGWEVSKTTNLGVDFILWDSNISGTFEYYDTKTDDLLLNRYLPITSGFNSVLENVGSTRNRGWELTLSFNVINNTSGFKWDVDANIFSNKEEIVELFKGTEDDVGNQWFIGYPINVFYNYKFDGIWQQDEADEAAKFNQKPGDIKIADVNGRDEDGKLSKQPDDKINTDDRTILGSTVPAWSGGLTNRISFKGFNFSMLIYARQGQMLLSQFHNFGGNRWEGRMSGINFNFWAPDNPSNEIPIPRKGKYPLYHEALQFHDGSFVKIKNITLGYDLNKSLLKSKNASSTQVYLSALNPLIFSKYDLVDPESASGNVGFNPFTSTTYIIGLNLKF